MTSISATQQDATVAGPVTVALLGSVVPAATPLLAALTTVPTTDTACWQLLTPDAAAAGMEIDIAICDGPAAVRAAERRWPDAEILALMSSADESGVLLALDAGAHVCVRESDSAVVAAYVHAIARRRGLLTAMGSR
jgi:DNA-binding NarL/FixJ family response regulator